LFLWQKNEGEIINYQPAFNQLMDIFITPEVKRRQEAHELETPLNLRSAQVIFYPDGRKPQVRINSEVKGIAMVRLKEGISLIPGDPIFENQLLGLEWINLDEDTDLDCGHATIYRINGVWTLTFDFRYNKALASKHITAAKEFYEVAAYSFEQKKLSPFVDNLYSAAELLAKATLLLMPDIELRKKASHASINAGYNKFANLGNVKPEYRDALNKLHGRRSSARYLQGDSISLTDGEARSYLDTVKAMIEDVEQSIKPPIE
jgi:uncharacterized protein (UPF0332 family)